MNISVIEHSSNKIKKQISRLMLCVQNENPLFESELNSWFYKNEISKDHQQALLKELERMDCSIHYDVIISAKSSDFNLDDEFDGDFDLMLESSEFKGEMELYEDVIDKSQNNIYLKELKYADEEVKARALASLVIANDKLVWKMVDYYKGLATIGFDQQDMYQSGIIGLMKAAEKFDLSLGYQFSTYAVWWIKQNILRDIANFSSVIRFPVHYREKMYKFTKEENEFWNEFARPATTSELSASLDMTVKEVEQLRFYLAHTNVDSLDKLVGENLDTSVVDLLPDQNTETPEKQYFNEEIKEIFKKIFKRELKDREIEILSYRFGLIDDREMTLEEIGKMQSVTRERIRQIEKKSLNKLRKKKNKELLKEYMYESH